MHFRKAKQNIAFCAQKCEIEEEHGWGGRAQIDWGWTEDDRQEKEGKIVLASFPFQILRLLLNAKEGYKFIETIFSFENILNDTLLVCELLPKTKTTENKLSNTMTIAT